MVRNRQMRAKKCMVESVDSSSVMKRRGWWVWGSMNKCAHVRFSTVTLFSVLHKAVATLLAPHQVLHVGHVVETHAPSLLEIAVQVSFAASAENTWEWMPEKGHFHYILEEQSLQKIDSINYSLPALFCWDVNSRFLCFCVVLCGIVGQHMQAFTTGKCFLLLCFWSCSWSWWKRQQNNLNENWW